MTVRAYFVKGLGGRFNLFDAGIRDVRNDIVAMPGVIDGGLWTFPERDTLVSEIRRQRVRAVQAVRIAIIGHSLGAVTACSVTDYTFVDLLALFDIAGGVPSVLGPNTGKCLDFFDTAADMVPEWRPQMMRGHESKMARYQGSMGHVQCPFNASWRRILKAEIEKLAK